jgi:hypothetical protein
MSHADPQPPTDLKLVKTEMYDADMMCVLADHEGVPHDVKKKMKAYRKRATDGNKVQVVYEYGEWMRPLAKGRIYPQKGLGLQSFPRTIRSALGAKYYFDMDIANAQPVLLVSLAKENGWVCSKLEEYTLNRSAKLQEVMAQLGCDRDDAKQFCLSIMFGKKYRNVPEYYVGLMEEISAITKNCSAKYPEMMAQAVKKAKKQNDGRNPEASCLAFVVQDLEAEVWKAMAQAVAGLGRSMDVNIHDGGLVSLEDGDDVESISDFTRQVEAEVQKKWPTICLTGEFLTHTFEAPPQHLMRGIVKEAEYQAQKTLFEEKRFYCMETSTICEETADGLRHVSRANGGSQFSSFNFNKVIDNGVKVQSFFNDWIEDPKMRTIERLVFKPEGCGADEYNLYRGMKGAKPTEVVPEIVERFKLLLFHNAGKDAVMNDYFTKWMALLVQKPWVIPGVALILVNEVQGTGKDTLFNFVGDKVVGAEYFKNITNAKEQVFNTHSQVQERCLFMKFEEANGYDNRQFADMLKGLITGGSAIINPKNVKPYRIDTFPHLCMTSNNKVPVKIEPNDRRFCITKTSADFRGDNVFWDETYALFERPEAGHSVWAFLNGVDLGGFNVKDFPKNDYHESLAHVERSSVDAFVESLEELEDCSATELHAKYAMYCRDNGFEPKNVVPLCRDLSAQTKIRRKVVHKQSRYFM